MTSETSSVSLNQFLTQCQQRVETTLQQLMNTSAQAAKLERAMAYASLNSGKRFRPVLAYAREIPHAEVHLLPGSHCVPLEYPDRFEVRKVSSAGGIRWGKQYVNVTSALQGEYVGLEAGGDEAFLAEGDQITLTQSALVLEQVIGQFLYSKASE